VDINKGAISNEFGNKLVQSLPTGFLPVGQIPLPDDNFIIFGNRVNTATPSGIITNSTSSIFLINTATNFIGTLLTTTTGDLAGHLNFDINNPITGEFRLSPTGEIIVYFTDNKYKFTVDPTTQIEYPEYYNPPRVFNTTRQQIFLSSGGTSNKLYTSTGQNITMLNIFMDSGRIPEFDSVAIVDGGGVATGAYYLAVSYADKDFTETNVLGMANPVYVHPSSETYIPFEMIGGSPGGTQTNKSIKCIYTKLDIILINLVPFINYPYNISSIFIIKNEIKCLMKNILKKNNKDFKNILMMKLFEDYIQSKLYPEDFIGIIVYNILSKIKLEN
jgi:hypothetical protein